jgi:hypothetical protein
VRPPDERTQRLRRAIAGLQAAKQPGLESVDLSPKSTHEAVTRQMVEDLAKDLGEVKSRVNAVLWAVVGAVVVDVAMRLAGAT